jgi:hypothetical protein
MCDCDVEEMFMASLEAAPAEQAETEAVEQPQAVPLVLTVKKRK